MSEWNYNLDEAPKQAILVTAQARGEGSWVTTADFLGGKWCNEDGSDFYGTIIAWMPLPDPAPLPEGD
jgi:hypothetical protein